MYCVKNVRAVVSRSAAVADTYCDSLKDDESLLVLKGLAVDFLGTNGAVAVFAGITV